MERRCFRKCSMYIYIYIYIYFTFLPFYTSCIVFVFTFLPLLSVFKFETTAIAVYGADNESFIVVYGI